LKFLYNKMKKSLKGIEKLNKQKWNGYINCEKELLTKQHLENILNDVFNKRINRLQSRQRDTVPPININGKFERYIK
jgi:hypothetical protein